MYSNVRERHAKSGRFAQPQCKNTVHNAVEKRHRDRRGLQSCSVRFRLFEEATTGYHDRVPRLSDSQRNMK